MIVVAMTVPGGILSIMQDALPVVRPSGVTALTSPAIWPIFGVRRIL